MFLHAARKRLEVGDTLLPLLQMIGKGMDNPAESFRRNVAQRQLGLIYFFGVHLCMCTCTHMDCVHMYICACGGH